MYAAAFGLRELPFNNTPDPRYFYSTADHEEALASLIYAVKERKGFVLLTGDVGAGKTLISRMMLRHFGTQLAFATINHAMENATDLLHAVCSELEIPVEPDATHAQIIRDLHDYLLQQFSQDIPVVLILDEAQNLPVAAFEQLRMIGNLEADDAKLLQIVMVGQPELQALFQTAQLRQLRQRIFRSFHLGAMNVDGTRGYIAHRLNVAGAEGKELFTEEAIERIHDVTQGVPRIINTICDSALLAAYAAKEDVADLAIVESVVDRIWMQNQRGDSRTPGEQNAWSSEAGVNPHLVNPVPMGAAGAWHGLSEAHVREQQAIQSMSSQLEMEKVSRTSDYSRMRMEMDSLRNDIRSAMLQITGALGGNPQAVQGALKNDFQTEGARATRHSLQAVVASANAVLRSAETTTEDLERRQKSTKKLVHTLRNVGREVTRKIQNLRDVADDAQRVTDQNREWFHATGGTNAHISSAGLTPEATFTNSPDASGDDRTPDSAVQPPELDTTMQRELWPNQSDRLGASFVRTQQSLQDLRRLASTHGAGQSRAFARLAAAPEQSSDQSATPEATNLASSVEQLAQLIDLSETVG